MSQQLKPEADALTLVVKEVIDEILSTSRELAPLDVLVALEIVDSERIELWRRGGLPYLERGIVSGLARVARILRIVQQQAEARGLEPKPVRYSKRGKGPRRALRFSKRGDAESERAYTTHFVKPGE
jgi:hypothetical protein